MTREELDLRKDELRAEQERKLISLLKEYIDANNPVKVGDVVRDHATTIKVESVSYYLNTLDPCAVYVGVELTKRGVPKKSGNKERVYQCNMEAFSTPEKGG
jgi:hypothetical protein